MSKIIVLTHGEFSKGITHSVNMILGQVDNIYPLSIQLETDISLVISQLKQLIEQFDKEEPIIIMTDIMGGSTSQAVLQIINEYDQVYLVTGLNLGLLLSIMICDFQDTTLIEDKINTLIEESKQGILCISKVMNIQEINDDEEL